MKGGVALCVGVTFLLKGHGIAKGGVASGPESVINGIQPTDNSCSNASRGSVAT